MPAVIPAFLLVFGCDSAGSSAESVKTAAAGPVDKGGDSTKAASKAPVKAGADSKPAEPAKAAKPKILGCD